MSTETEMAGRFPKDVAAHEMTVLRDDGLYRHLRFMRVALNPKTGKPERSSFYWFELVTWPNHLTITGDCGTYTFSRVEDMFSFFRGGRINPQYWAEKVRGEMRLKRYGSERFRQLVTEHISEGDEQFPSLAQEWPGLADAVEREIFGDGSRWNTEHEDSARDALDEFEFGATYTAKCQCGEQREGLEYGAAENWRLNHRTPAGDQCSRLPRATITKVEGFTFTDSWEWDLGDWDWQFLWCCHAIQWGIQQYDEGRDTALRPTETVELPA